MHGMSMGDRFSVGSLGFFVVLWVLMMAAMMFPSVAPTVALYSRMGGERTPFSAVVFAAGYLVTWTGAGVLAFSIALGGHRVAEIGRAHV